MNKNLHKNPSVLTHADISSKEKLHVLYHIALHNITEIFPESYMNFYTLIYQFDFSTVQYFFIFFVFTQRIAIIFLRLTI